MTYPPDHEVIYLEPRDHPPHEETGRSWCQNNVWDDCEEAATKYVRADRYDALKALFSRELEETRAELEEAKRVLSHRCSCSHHSGTLIDECRLHGKQRASLTQARADFADMRKISLGMERERDDAREEIERLRKALAPFAEISRWLDECQDMDRAARLPTYISIQSSGIGGSTPLNEAWFRAAARATAFAPNWSSPP